MPAGREFLEKMVNAYGVSIDWLLFGVGEVELKKERAIVVNTKERDAYFMEKVKVIIRPKIMEIRKHLLDIEQLLEDKKD